MKSYLFIIISICICSSCDLEATKDCWQSKGDIITRSYNISGLKRITIRENIRLEITYSENEKLEAVGGKSHLDHLTILENDNGFEFAAEKLCKTGFSTAPITLKLYTSDLNYIRNSSQFDVISTNRLEFSNLTLIAEEFNDPEALNLGSFKLSVQSERIRITGTGFSNFEIDGETKTFNFGTYSGSGSILARNLVAKDVVFHHRSFSDAVVNPIESLKGEIRSTGNLISIKKPPVVEVKEFYTGRLIFE